MTNWDKCINELGTIGVGTFDVPNHFVKWLKDNISNKHKIKITRIGVIKSTEYRYSLNSKQYNPKVSGYDHFKGKQLL